MLCLPSGRSVRALPSGRWTACNRNPRSSFVAGRFLFSASPVYVSFQCCNPFLGSFVRLLSFHSLEPEKEGKLGSLYFNNVKSVTWRNFDLDSHGEKRNCGCLPVARSSGIEDMCYKCCKRSSIMWKVGCLWSLWVLREAFTGQGAGAFPGYESGNHSYSTS